MSSLKVKIINEAGLHARPASIIASIASKFDSKITLKFKEKTADLKSIMNIMALGIKQNSEIEIMVEGSDAEEALKTIKLAMKENELV